MQQTEIIEVIFEQINKKWYFNPYASIYVLTIKSTIFLITN